MKKSLLAIAALAAFAGAAQAQSSVTIYGILDEGVIAQSNQNIRNTAVPTAGANYTASPQGQNQTTMPITMGSVLQTSRLGFKGAEDLGSGLKAVFTAEMGFTVPTGAVSNTSVLFNRQSFAGFEKANWGTLTFGRQYLFGYESAGSGITDPLMLAFDIANGNALGGFNATQTGPSNTGSSAFTSAIKVNPMNSVVGSFWSMDRANSAIKAKSASFGGAYAGAMLGLGGKSGSIGSNQSTSLVLGWGGYGAKVETTATTVNDDSAMNAATAAVPTQTTTRKSQQWTLGATYQVLPSLGVQAGYTANKMDAGFSNSADGVAVSQLLPSAFFGTLGQKVKLSVTTAGANYMITPTIKATVGYARSNLNGDFINSGSANTYSAIMNYYLSKRTDLYSAVSNTVVRDGLYSNVGSNTTYNNNAQRASTMMAIGMRHTF